MKPNVKVELFPYLLNVSISRKLSIEEWWHNELSDWYINN